jgi:hypothetical protein
VFATDIHFQLTLMLVSKARSLPLERSHVISSILVGSSLACKYKTRVKVNYLIGKHSSFVRNSINYGPEVPEHFVNLQFCQTIKMFSTAWRGDCVGYENLSKVNG